MTASANPSRSNTLAQPSRRTVIVKWLRKTHGWLGLWGATLGLLFGMTGIVQNHRAILKISTPRPQESTVQLPLPKTPPEDADALADWLQHDLGLSQKAARIKTEDEHPVAWSDKTLQQPEHWSVMFSSPRFNVQADYWVGNNFVMLKRTDNGLLATLSSLHKGVGVGVGWILLADSFAGSIILLSLSGIAMWLLTNQRKVVGLVIGGISVAMMIGLAWLSLQP